MNENPEDTLNNNSQRKYASTSIEYRINPRKRKAKAKTSIEKGTAEVTHIKYHSNVPEPGDNAGQKAVCSSSVDAFSFI